MSNNGIPSTTVHTLAVSETNLFAGTNGSGIYISTNNGLNWSSVNNGLTNTYIHSLASSGSDIFAGSEGGLVYISTNNGSSWSGINVGSAASTFNTFTFSSTNSFAGASAGGVFLSTDNGLSWNAVNTGLSDIDVLSLTVKDDTLFAGTFSSGVWKRSLSEIITSADDLIINLPAYFSLAQNYPNPFNPNTKISWQSPVGSHQTLKVYDVLGNEVATLVNEERPAGSYEVDFNAAGLSSGIYFYRLQAGSFVETKKMILLR
ncbi:MAG: T9SS type A sorting domain-containing protein [Ignavibacterium sp.]